MTGLTDNWTVDRSPGGGKTVYATPGDATTETPINPVTGVGGSDPDIGVPEDPGLWPALIEPGEALPPPGHPDRPGKLIVFRRATGFNGNSWLSGIPAVADSSSWSFSGWFNFGVDNVVGFTPSTTPVGMGIGQFAIGDNDYAGAGTWYLNTGRDPSPLGPYFVAGGADVPLTASVTYPSDVLLGLGWFHLMIAVKSSGSYAAPNNNQRIRQIIYIGDTGLVNDSVTYSEASGVALFNTAPFSMCEDVGIAEFINFGRSFYEAPVNLYAACTEIWEAPGQFVDWSVQANREKFHTSDSGWGVASTTYAPVDLGRSGARPTGRRPRLYLSGGPSIFRRNRARGGTLLTLTGDALVAVDDPPGGV